MPLPSALCCWFFWGSLMLFRILYVQWCQLLCLLWFFVAAVLRYHTVQAEHAPLTPFANSCDTPLSVLACISW